MVVEGVMTFAPGAFDPGDGDLDDEEGGMSLVGPMATDPFGDLFDDEPVPAKAVPVRY